MTLPVTIVLICWLSAGLLAHPVTFGGYASLAMMVSGACLLTLARWPLLRQRHFFKFGSGNLAEGRFGDASERRGAWLPEDLGQGRFLREILLVVRDERGFVVVRPERIPLVLGLAGRQRMALRAAITVGFCHP